MDARMPSDIVNFAAGPAKLPHEVKIATLRFFRVSERYVALDPFRLSWRLAQRPSTTKQRASEPWVKQAVGLHAERCIVERVSFFCRAQSSFEGLR